MFWPFYYDLLLVKILTIASTIWLNRLVSSLPICDTIKLLLAVNSLPGRA